MTKSPLMEAGQGGGWVNTRLTQKNGFQDHVKPSEL